MSDITFEQILREQGRLVHTNVGDSMMPLLRQGRDLMVIEQRPQGRCKRLDAVLYKRPNGKYVMHRILKVREHDYVICGDNRYTREFGVPDEWIIGVLTGVIRDGKKQISTRHWNYRLYVHLWCDFFWVRAFLIRVGRTLAKIKRKIVK
ncbi:MAG: S24/S26 family peptidase [Oscillospiraceae bacterium]|nr:S24/S26 family peptidase [Oscillospiraceae bacterium]